MATVTSEGMRDLGEFFRMVMEDAGMFPVRPLTEEEAPGTLAVLVQAAERLTPEARVGLLLIAVAWGG